MPLCSHGLPLEVNCTKCLDEGLRLERKRHANESCSNTQPPMQPSWIIPDLSASAGAVPSANRTGGEVLAVPQSLPTRSWSWRSEELLELSSYRSCGPMRYVMSLPWLIRSRP
jgi:hypothetical protein